MVSSRNVPCCDVDSCLLFLGADALVLEQGIEERTLFDAFGYSFFWDGMKGDYLEFFQARVDAWMPAKNNRDQDLSLSSLTLTSKRNTYALTISVLVMIETILMDAGDVFLGR